MKKKLVTGIATMAVSMSLLGCANTTKDVMNKEDAPEVEIENVFLDLIGNEEFKNVLSYTSSTPIDYSNVVYPVFYVFAGQKSEEEAEKLVQELGIGSVVDTWAGSVNVVSPLDGKGYSEKDAESFVELLGPATSNIKVIGLDDGATFVNEYLREKLYPVAGVMTYGGEMSKEATEGCAIPAYLSNPDDKALSYFVAANEATEVGEGVYENKENPLQKVVVGKEETAKEAFKNAWETVFSKNYRQHNSLTEFYNANAKDITSDYELIGIADYEALGIQYEAHYNEPLNGEGEYTWFEYIPTSTLEKENGSVPLVVALHGNKNDARLEGDSTGWPELASKEQFMVVAPEWQAYVVEGGSTEKQPNYFECDGLQDEKLIEWIDMLKEKYPQIDSSRVYVTGLSAGASASTLYGAKYSNVFAAVGAVSGPGVDKVELAEIAEKYDGGEVPYLYVCGDHDFFGMLPVDLSSKYSFPIDLDNGVYIQHVDPNVDMFSFIQSYQKINGLEVSEKYDLKKNEFYGVQLDNQEWIKLGTKDALEGTLSNKNGVVIKLAGVKNLAHWNYKPEAEYIWNFFKQYSRNEDGSLNRQ
ncbi:MAG: poly(3-hydroxybutyrate) depolymerase [Firmicutes bacterium]|nr:poly(3-hydroxybutyrate) depolymerase [Bacillota bacterium]